MVEGSELIRHNGYILTAGAFGIKKGEKVWSEKPSKSSSAKAVFAKSKKTLSHCRLCHKDDITRIGSKIAVFQHMSDEPHKEQPPHREPSSGEC